MTTSTPVSLLAARGDTWGIPGPTFLALYLVAAAVLIVLAVYAVVAGLTGRVDPPARQLSPEEIGYLAGGRRQAYLTALTALRAQGLVEGGGSGRIVATRGAGQPLSELQLAILAATSRGARTPVVLNNTLVRTALDNIRTQLQDAGLLAAQGRMRIIRLVPKLSMLLIVIGVARAGSGFIFGRPVRDLALTMVVVALVGVTVRFAGRSRTSAGTDLVRRLRAENDHLRDSQHPSWATYGVMGAGLSVALFGASSMFAFDPAFAAEAAIPRYAGSGSYGGDGGSSSSWSDSGSSWSDSGSSGGSDGGGSSCGGGSGCGGGGCGG